MTWRERFKTFIPVDNEEGRMINVGVNFPLPMSQAQWDQFQATLDIFKEALVEPGAPVTETEQEENR